MYARDVQGRRGEGIDTGFGLSSGRGAGGTAIVFVDVVAERGVGGCNDSASVGMHRPMSMTSYAMASTRRFA